MPRARNTGKRADRDFENKCPECDGGSVHKPWCSIGGEFAETQEKEQ